MEEETCEATLPHGTEVHRKGGKIETLRVTWGVPR